MKSDRFRATFTAILEQADIRISGDRPWDIAVHDPRFFRRVMAQGTLGVGESYMDGWWDSERLDQTVFRFLRAGQDQALSSLSAVLDHLRARLFNRQNRRRAFQVGRKHYDLGNDLFSRMLDSRMIYSCGYWQDATPSNRPRKTNSTWSAASCSSAPASGYSTSAAAGAALPASWPNAMASR